MTQSPTISIDDCDQVVIDPITELLAGDFLLAETGEWLECPTGSLIFEHKIDGCERGLDFPKLPLPPAPVRGRS